VIGASSKTVSEPARDLVTSNMLLSTVMHTLMNTSTLRLRTDFPTMSGASSPTAGRSRSWFKSLRGIPTPWEPLAAQQFRLRFSITPEVVPGIGVLREKCGQAFLHFCLRFRVLLFAE